MGGTTGTVERIEYRRVLDLLGPAVPSAVAYRTAGQQPRLHRGLPSPYLTLIFALDVPVVGGVTPEHAQNPDAQRSWIVLGGLHRSPAFVLQPSAQVGVQLAIHPLAARRLFGASAAELARTFMDGEEVLGAEGRRVRDRLAASPTPEVTFDLLADYLHRRLDASSRARRVRPEVLQAWRWMSARRGAGSIADLHRHVQLSNRQLTTLFTREVGLSPKQVSGLMRFEHAKQRIAAATSAGRVPELTEVALRCGYYDLAHLDRNFAGYVGLSPSAWIAEERRNLQAGGHRNGRQWSHDDNI